MGSIRIRIDIAADGTITGKAPPGLPPGVREIVVPEQTAPAGKTKAGDLPLDDCGAWPDDLSLRREDLYRDDGR